MLHIQSSTQYYNRKPVNNTVYLSSDTIISTEIKKKKIHVSPTDCFENNGKGI